ncbi:MAG: 30S ribosomal protein S3 [Deltaproteobacteria bacterium]|nr:30S ribosomal protein S3 [Deltaproteobacteria bacterium]MBW1736201.1 30S ribosomal protein S3 [Deltaproteobacteria bacterium]MBW1908822.1 30S ribosomal protein S3 [Deltaproteobacteria bacterium]MBW2032704.1 30S ribosomal protein S3 [Deltaproteobacteria bacterium]MBW2113649.1 30S ribosomal protein S3 [Deltaproteobacteria bacterium]
MGQKVHPIGFRLGINRNWDSRWFAGKEYSHFVLEDYRIRKFLKKRVFQAGVARIEIERAASKVRIRMHTARPGIVIGKKGSEIEKLKRDLEKEIKREVIIDIQEVRKAEVEAQLVAENVALQLVRRIAFRRAMKKSVSAALRFGAQGIKIACSGRLGGAEMARREWYREGRVPLHTIRADIDYGFAEAYTKYGVIGVKVTIFKGEVLPARNKEV